MDDDGQKPQRWLGVLFAVMLTTRTLAGAFAPALFAFAPVVLIILSPFVPNLVMAAPEVPPLVFFGTVIAVAIPHCLIGFFFGEQYGTAASRWIVEKTPLGENGLERLLRATRYSAPAVLMALPGPLSSVLAGVARVPRTLYGVVMVPTQVVWFIGCFYLGESLVHAIRDVRVFVVDNVLLLTLATVLIFVLRWLPRWVRAD